VEQSGGDPALEQQPTHAQKSARISIVALMLWLLHLQ